MIDSCHASGVLFGFGEEFDASDVLIDVHCLHRLVVFVADGLVGLQGVGVLLEGLVGEAGFLQIDGADQVVIGFRCGFLEVADTFLRVARGDEGQVT